MGTETFRGVPFRIPEEGKGGRSSCPTTIEGRRPGWDEDRLLTAKPLLVGMWYGTEAADAVESAGEEERALGGFFRCEMAPFGGG